MTLNIKLQKFQKTNGAQLPKKQSAHLTVQYPQTKVHGQNKKTKS